MLDFDYVCKRAFPSVAGLVTPDGHGFHKVFFGNKEIMIPVYGSTKEARAAAPEADVFINFASYRSAYASSKEALSMDGIRVVVIIAEGVPETEVRELIDIANDKGKIIIGPATVGGMQAGAFKIGDAAGTIDNIIKCKLYRPGSVGFVSKSGGLSNEMYNVLSRTTNGIFEGISIGGDVFPGSTMLDHLLRFEKIPEVKMTVILGELGGQVEYDIVAALKDGRITKPLCAWVTGTCAKMFPGEVQFGHAGAKSGSQEESAESKNAALRAAGANVPDSFEDFADVITKVYDGLVANKTIVPAEDDDAPSMPVDTKTAVKQGQVRQATNIVSTICDDRGDEPLYAGVPISELIKGNASMADVVCLLWFKKRLPRWATKFVELVLVVTADHGPCVSGAHNTIVAARAGKDLVSCLASGLLTIGPRFGGAIDGAARHFKRACDGNLRPDEFVEDMKKRGMRVPGIGHRIKSAHNLDQRVVYLCRYAKDNFPSTKYLDYALSVETYTLKKASNLVLNVDGCIASVFLDLMVSSEAFTAKEQADIVDIGYLNGLFVLGRSIGLIGHALDQKRLKQPLYRHPWEDVLYSSQKAPKLSGVAGKRANPDFESDLEPVSVPGGVTRVMNQPK